MSLFKRKSPKPKPRLPEVYISYYPSKEEPNAIRFFFMDELWPQPSKIVLENGRTRHSAISFSRESRELLEEIKTAVSANYINPHRQYIAVHWRADDDTPVNAEEVVLELLARHFGWEDPLVEYFDYPSEQKFEVERLRRIHWSPSS